MNDNEKNPHQAEDDVEAHGVKGPFATEETDERPQRTA